jgi:hypothetical protein
MKLDDSIKAQTLAETGVITANGGGINNFHPISIRGSGRSQDDPRKLKRSAASLPVFRQCIT